MGEADVGRDVSLIWVDSEDRQRGKCMMRLTEMTITEKKDKGYENSG